MSNNRIEQEALIQALAPTVDLTELQAAIITDGYLFKKDVSVSQINPPASALGCNFATVDQVILEFTGNKTISIKGLEDGQTGRIFITKGVNDTVTFIGVTGTIDGRQIGRTTLSYEAISFNGNVVVRQLRGVQDNGDMAGGTFSPNSGVIDSVSFVEYNINNNMCTIHGRINWTTPATIARDLLINQTISLPFQLNTLARSYIGAGSVGTASGVYLPVRFTLIQPTTSYYAYNFNFDDGAGGSILDLNSTYTLDFSTTFRIA